MRLRDILRTALMGRYGRDQLNKFLSVLCVVLLVAGFILRFVHPGFRLLSYLAVAVLVILYLRTFSRNFAKRSAENEKYLQLKEAFFGGFSRKKRQMQDKDHAYFKCPRCKKMLRVPRGKGRISIHCPQCGTDFIEKT